VPADPDVAQSVRQVMESVVQAGEGAMQAVFEEKARA